MRKILLSAAALVVAMCANAQVFQMDGEAHGLTSDLSNVAAGYVWGTIDGAIDISNAFETQHKLVDGKNDDFTKVVIDGNEILTKGGIQGNDNPKDGEGGNPAVTFQQATGGAVIQIDAKKDGWVYIVAKLSTNKQYMVFEEGLPIGYKIALESNNEAIPNGVLNLEIKGEGEYNNLSLDQYPGGLKWVIREATGNAEAESAGNGLGVFYFPVAKDCKYYAHATGSKIMWSGVYFSETEAQTVTVEGEGISRTIVGEGGSQPAGNTVLWEGPMVFDGWSVSFVIEPEKFANVKAGDIIRANYTDKGADFNPIYKHVNDWSDWTDFQNAMERQDTYIQAPVTEAAIAELQSTGLRFQGVGFTMTSVELISSTTGIQAVKTAKAQSNVLYNLAGQKVNSNYKGVVVVNGQKMIQK
jgi:hypothetical protein